MNHFAHDATSTAFSISLSKSMVDVLFRIEYNIQNPQDQQYGLYFGAGSDLWITAVKGCERRGLVKHNPPKIAKSGPNKGYAEYNNNYPAFVLTEAGKHVLELCKLAELVPTSKARSFRQVA